MTKLIDAETMAVLERCGWHLDRGTLSVPKPTRIHDPAYLGYLRTLPCCVCRHLGEVQTTRTEAHHMKTRGSGGGDDTAISLCKRHHQQWHLIGRETFGAKYRIDLLGLAAVLYQAYRLGWAA